MTKQTSTAFLLALTAFASASAAHATMSSRGTQLAFYAGWPNAFSAVPIVKACSIRGCAEAMRVHQ
jgi:hypothetical protein